ncbi:fumarylacetoacetate hydrolase [Prosthecochloris sp. GSB1]|uniref:fumarylacetoacetate hydrolase family protein n=1 Tax=Prosthecochloris sp. GSB1 TaxID=281093 RepID=UPI000B8CCA2D|nr:fumarylacetoacetate hydrolase family protein [Prosthecochloris sp. GSB1]ASQ90563.1 fumarylacetoacetate hydrolase [Prosthecochloris sp. GSB1]
MNQPSSRHPEPSSIFCVGKNYRLHAEEMRRWESAEGAEAERPEEEPIIFLKSPSALSTDGTTTIPSLWGKPVSNEMHYEAELVLLVGSDASDIGEKDAGSCIAGYGVGLDMTLRDVQIAAKKKGNPWFKSKGFKKSALVSGFVPASEVSGAEALAFELRLNDRIVQRGDPRKMLFGCSYLISYLSYIYGLRAGDLIFTGTPEGVGPATRGDRLTASLHGNGNGAAVGMLAGFSVTVA